MKETKTKNLSLEAEVEQHEVQNEALDRQSILELFKTVADDKAHAAFEKLNTQLNEIFELQSGKKTSLAQEWTRYRKIFEDNPQVYDPKFSRFFEEFGKMMGWPEEKSKAYYKPYIVPQTINEVIYARFPKEVISHIQAKNPYIRWCTRAHKNYLFLSEEGIIKLEKFIDDAVSIMPNCTSLYDFRMKHAEAFGTGFQPVLFEEYYM